MSNPIDIEHEIRMLEDEIKRLERLNYHDELRRKAARLRRDVIARIEELREELSEVLGVLPKLEDHDE
jgi:hypothetical protein